LHAASAPKRERAAGKQQEDDAEQKKDMAPVNDAIAEAPRKPGLDYQL
jgi:hypothetical protein